MWCERAIDRCNVWWCADAGVVANSDAVCVYRGDRCGRVATDLTLMKTWFNHETMFGLGVCRILIGKSSGHRSRQTYCHKTRFAAGGPVIATHPIPAGVMASERNSDEATCAVHYESGPKSNVC